jgi:hypothetical protein
MAPLTGDTCLSWREQVIAQENSGALVLFNMNNGQYYALNEVGKRIWELCDGSRSLEQVANILAEEYDSPAETIKSDMFELVDELMTADLLVESQHKSADWGTP